MEARPVITLNQVAKRYLIYSKPQDRLKQMIFRGRRQFGREFWALRNTSLTINAGEVVGIVGRNGAGKSTFLQLVCGTLTPSQGQVKVDGVVAALLELGAGFNMEFTGRENIYMNGAILGLSRDKLEKRFDDIVKFADIGDVIDQPVKTYSSGMYVRLAFAVAVHVDPEILIIDEALSVGDGVFARKSFDRIMAMKDAGKTILFCSHSTYHIESICSRAIWLHQGEIRMDGPASRVVSAYNDFLGQEMHGASERNQEPEPVMAPEVAEPPPVYHKGQGRLLEIRGAAAGMVGKRVAFHGSRDDFSLHVDFLIDPELPKPSVLMALYSMSGVMVCSAGTHNDGFVVNTQADGRGSVELRFPKMSLLKGEYFINVYFACERGLHYYDSAPYAVELEVTQDGLEQGVVTLPHIWHS